MQPAVITVIGFLCTALQVFPQVNQERKLDLFDKLKITNEVTVYLTQGDSAGVKIEAFGIDPDDVLTTVTAKTLEIGLQRGVYKDISVNLYLTYQELRDVFVSSSGKAIFQGSLAGDKVVLNAHSGAQVDADINLRTLDIMATKGASIRLRGKTGSYEATISTGANLSALDVAADSAFVNVSTKSIAKVSAKKLLDAKVKSGSTLTVEGSPEKKNIKAGIGTTILEQ